MAGWRVSGLAAMAASGLVAGCILETPERRMEVLGLAKWYKDYPSVYSPTYDTPYLDGPELAWLIGQGLSIDLEIISELYQNSPGKIDTLRDSLASRGLGYFGHGHTHINHDALTYDSAYSSYKINFDYMKEKGLRPVSYAYPGGYGHETETRDALRNAGWLSARLAWHWDDDDPGRAPHIMPDDEKTPRNWYMLPALGMQALAFENCDRCVNNPREFSAYLHASVKKRAWLISVYHAIGWDGMRHPLGWGYYNLEDFYQEMLLAKSLRDQGKLWIASMDAVTLYVMERNATTWKLSRKGPRAFELRLTNDLDTLRFNHKMTVRLSFPGSVGKRLKIGFLEDGSALMDTVIENEEVLVDLHPSHRPYGITIH
jgi:hypothetical protein